MIYDKIENSGLYERLSPLLQKAFSYIRSGHDFNVEAFDRWIYLDGEKLYYKVTDLETIAPAPVDYRYEHHRRYVDLHYILSGTEAIALADAADLHPCDAFNEELDCGFARGAQLGLVTLRPGDFMICFPEDGHRCWLGDGHRIRKVLFKIDLASFE